MAPRWGGLRPEPYKLSPPDADSDMIVQEGTAWERPGGLRLLDRLGNAITAGMESLSPVDGLRYVDAGGKDVAYVPTWTGDDVPVPGTGLRTLSSMSGVRTVGEMTSGSASLKDRGLALGDRRKAVAEAIREAQKPQVAAVVVPEWKPGDPLPKRSHETKRDVVDTSKKKKGVVDSPDLTLDEADDRIDLKFDSAEDRESLLSALEGLSSKEKGNFWDVDVELDDDDPWGDKKSEEQERLDKLIVEVKRTIDVAEVMGDSDDPFGDSEGKPARPAELSGKEAVTHLEDIFSSDEDKEILDKIKEQRKIVAIKKARTQLEWDARLEARESATKVTDSYHPKGQIPTREERGRDDKRPNRDYSAEQVATSDQSDVDQRDLETLIDHADGTMVYARGITEDLTAETVVDDLERITSSLSSLTVLEEQGGSPTPMGETHAGRSLVDELVEARGFDGDTLKVTSDELDEMVLSGGFVEVARGGRRQYQEDHLHGTVLMGTGVDGAGLYFALERKEGGAFSAASYAAGETDGVVIRGGVNPTAKTIHVKQINKMVEGYRKSVGDRDHHGVPTPMSEGDEISEELDGLLQVRQALSLKAQGLAVENGKVVASPVDEEMKSRTLKQLKNLDSMVLASNDGDQQHSTTAVAVLLGYDAIYATSTDTENKDNRVIVLNRSAVVVADTVLETETVGDTSYAIDRDGKHVVGEAALAERMNPVLDDRGAPRFTPGEYGADEEFIERQVEKTLEKFDEANAPEIADGAGSTDTSVKAKKVKRDLAAAGGQYRMTAKEREAFTDSEVKKAAGTAERAKLGDPWAANGKTGVELVTPYLRETQTEEMSVLERLRKQLDIQDLILAGPQDQAIKDRHAKFKERLQRGIDYLESHTDEEFVADLAKALRIWHDDEENDLSVAIPYGPAFDGFLEEGYKTTHEVTSDHSGEDIRGDYEVSQGVPRDAPESVRPASGFVHAGATKRHLAKKNDEDFVPGRDHPDRDHTLTDLHHQRVMNGKGIYGQIHLVLNPDVKERTKAGEGDSLNYSVRGAPMVGATDEELVDSFLAVDGGKGAKDRVQFDKIKRALELVIDGPGENQENIGYREQGTHDEEQKLGGHNYVEAMIYGSFDIDDVAEIRIPPTVWTARSLGHTPMRSMTPSYGRDGTPADQALMGVLQTGRDIKDLDPEIEELIRKALIETPEQVRDAMRNTQFIVVMDNLASMRKRADMLAAVRAKNKEVKVTFLSEKGIDMDDASILFGAEGVGKTVEQVYQARLVKALEQLAIEIEKWEPPVEGIATPMASRL
jgi:hypothetical protein